MGVYLEGEGHLVSRLIMGIIGVTMWFIGGYKYTYLEFAEYWRLGFEGVEFRALSCKFTGLQSGPGLAPTVDGGDPGSGISGNWNS